MKRIVPVHAPRVHSGFTLVEMLVAVGLVVLMMAMFASVFQLATGAMSKQKGLAENDQRARLVTTILQSDLQKRTFRHMLPLLPNVAPPYPTLQQGYFHISENDPGDDTDDLLQFTFAIHNTQRNKDTTPLYGRTVPLVREGTGRTAQRYMLANPNQPELDDGQVEINNTGTSSVGEVAYFLRNGILYRRVMLVRTPLVGSNATPTGYSDGMDAAGNDSSVSQQDLIQHDPGPNTDPYTFGTSTTSPGYLVAPDNNGDPARHGSGVFWRDFDYSAVNLEAIDGDTNDNVDLPVFLGASGATNYLDNSFQTGATTGVAIFSLGMPNMRWGFRTELTSGVAGRSREYVPNVKTTASAGAQPADPPVFFGRFTHEETSHDDFLYPGSYSDPTQYPFSRSDLTLIQDSGVIEEYAGGPRRGEDILMTNVHAFDIKVFDDHPSVQDFKDLGWDKTTGTDTDCHYCKARNEDTTHGDNHRYGPHVSGNAKNNVFDTWHPNFDLDNDSMTVEGPPIRVDWDNGPDQKPGIAFIDDDGLMGVDDAGEQGWLGSDDHRPLRSIQITIRYVETVTGQMKNLTLVQTLTDSD